MVVLAGVDAAIDPARGLKVGLLIHIHQRLDHISSDTILRIARKSESGIEITDRRIRDLLA